jgi:hypothetical protein
MIAIERQPISARIRADLAEFLETYREKHSLATRTDALEKAILALQQLERDAELREGYRQMALDYAKNPDPWLDADLKYTLDAIDRG